MAAISHGLVRDQPIVTHDSKFFPDRNIAMKRFTFIDRAGTLGFVAAGSASAADWGHGHGGQRSYQRLPSRLTTWSLGPTTAMVNPVMESPRRMAT